jgi:threonylcarbamoyladenosine tRNA methylthiotransferase MtaB
MAGLEGLERLRISSLEPNLLTDDILNLVRDSPVVCDHLHIPLQSGSDTVLRAMRRRYTAGYYRERILAAKERMPACGIGVDVIVGFPGESDADFEETYLLLNELPISYLHVFTFSERPHAQTPADRRAVPPAVRARRNEMLRILGQKKERAFYDAMRGRTATVLTESDVVEGMRRGFTSNFVRVEISESAADENELVSVIITGLHDDRCVGVPNSGRASA